jgi:F0F1-type ATP synthase assembly protein I
LRNFSQAGSFRADVTAPQAPRRDSRDPERRVARSFGEGYAYVGAGFTFAFAILLFGAGGWALDGWLGTRPLFAVIGALLGGVAGFLSLYTRVTRQTEKDKRERGTGSREP